MFDRSHDLLLFWKNHEPDLPTWAAAARQVLLIQPSSAASESVFSSFGERQNSSLQSDTSCTIHYTGHSLLKYPSYEIIIGYIQACLLFVHLFYLHFVV